MNRKADDENLKSRKKRKLDKDKSHRSIIENNDNESDLSDCDKFSDDEEGGIRIDDIYIPPAPPPVCSYETTGPRLIITHIVNENFKSYAGRVVVGPFDKSFSSIVGPNGSGKSNVIDSMLFVFGYRATKIRSKKVSVLIHKSEKHQNITSCKVEVHFVQIVDKENGEYDKIPGSEFVISRTAFQNSLSFYELNNKRVQFKEVAMTLRKHGIDLIHNRFLILQGEVEQIALMKPKAQNPHETGMLEYLEDIIGTVRFKEPIEKLQARIETLNEERQEKLNRLKVVENERDALKGPMEETVNFLKTENRITQLKNKKYQILLYEVGESVNEKEEDKKVYVENLQKINDKLNEMQEQKGAEKEEMESLNKIVQKESKKYEELVEMNKNAEKKETSLTEEYNQLKKNKKKTADSLQEEEEKLKALLKIPEKNQSKIEKLSAEEIELNEKRKEEEVAFQKIMSNLQKETKGFQEEKDKLQVEQMKIKKIYDDKRSAFELAKSERDIYLSTEQTEKAKLEQLQCKLTYVIDTIDSRRNELKSLEKELPIKEKEMTEAENELSGLRSRLSETTTNVRKYKSQLEEKKCFMSANRSRNRVLDFLMCLKMEGKVPGIFGRLGDLGAIDEKYDVAVSTASGALDYIIVNNADTVEKCLAALKANDVGRATFLALDKVTNQIGNRYNIKMKTPENVHRLFDLIRVQDDRVRPAFYFALRDTLVADNLEQATRIAYGATRYRVVTLKGELIEISGTMSGGGRQVLRGKMGSSVSVATDNSTVEEINHLEETVENLERQLQDYRVRERTSEEIVSKFAPLINTMKMNINKLSIELQGLSKQEPELKSQLSAQKKKVKECAPNENRVRELSEKVEANEKSMKNIEVDVNAIEKKVNEVHEKIMRITGGKTEEAQKRLDDVTKEWEKVRSSINQLQVAIKTSERNAKKARERIENMKSELEETDKREEEIRNEREILKKDSQMLNEKANALKEEMDEKLERLKVLQEENKTFVSQINKLKAVKLKEEQELEQIEKTISEIKNNIPSLEHKLKKLTLHKIPTFRDPDDDDNQEVATDNNNEEETRRSTSDNRNCRNSMSTNNELNSAELIKYTVEQLKEMKPSEIKNSLEKEEEYLKTLNPNHNTLQDYEKKTKQYIERTKELKEITERRNRCRDGYEEARKNRFEEFMTSFNIISNKLKELYQMLTMGGDAELDLHDSMDPFTEGINFCVRPPKKSWKNITNLSGGEKTLSSLALVFALHYYRPTPLYVMDEIDAALDFKNVSIVGYYIKERTKNAQFIVISLRTNMFELANILTGIYKTYNCTKTITVRPDTINKILNPLSALKETNERTTQPFSRHTQNEENRRRKSRKSLANRDELAEIISTEKLNNINCNEESQTNNSSVMESDKENNTSNSTDTDYSAIDIAPSEQEILRMNSSVI